MLASSRYEARKATLRIEEGDSEALTFAALLTEAPEGGWGLWGRAHTNEELVAAARTEIAKRTPEATKGGV